MDKAKKAYELVQQPVMVNDTGWFITALHGFPAAYMKYANYWLTARDFLNLMKDHEDREVILKQVICYVDANQTKLFVHEQKGVVLSEAKGEGIPSTQVFSFDGVNSIAEINAKTGKSASDQYNLWAEFAQWLTRT